MGPVVHGVDGPGNPRSVRLRATGPRIGWPTGVLLLAAVVRVATHLAQGRARVRFSRTAEPSRLRSGMLLQLMPCVRAGAVGHRAIVHRGVSRPAAMSAMLTDLVACSLVELISIALACTAAGEWARRRFTLP